MAQLFLVGNAVEDPFNNLSCKFDEVILASVVRPRLVKYELFV